MTRLVAGIERPGWIEEGSTHCLWITHVKLPIEPSPFELGDGSLLHVGDRLTRLAGKRSAAGFPRLTLHPGSFLEYAGLVRNERSCLVLFRASAYYDTADLYAGYFALEGGRMMYYTASNAMRRVETTDCVRMAPA